MITKHILYRLHFRKLIINSDEKYKFEISDSKTVHFIPQIGMKLVNPKGLYRTVEIVRDVCMNVIPHIKSTRDPKSLKEEANWIIDEYTYHGDIALEGLDLAKSKRDEQNCDPWFLTTREDYIMRSYHKAGKSVFKSSWDETSKEYRADTDYSKWLRSIKDN